MKYFLYGDEEQERYTLGMAVYHEHIDVGTETQEKSKAVKEIKRWRRVEKKIMRTQINTDRQTEKDMHRYLGGQRNRRTCAHIFRWSEKQKKMITDN